MLPNQHEDVTHDRKRVEQKQRTALSPTAGQPAAGIGVNCAEQGLQSVKEANEENTHAEGFEILGREAEPDALARSGQNQRHEQQHWFAAQCEEVGDAAPAVHVASFISGIFLSKQMFLWLTLMDILII